MLEMFVDLVHERLARDPGMHVYHYGAYEKAAMTQLMGIYATREEAVDELLRRKIFVNLHTVVRQGLRAGVPSYSLKEVEALAQFAREADVKTGTRAVLAHARWMEARDESLLGNGHDTRGHSPSRSPIPGEPSSGALLNEIAAYNAEDCRATLALRDWLVANRPADARRFEAVAAEARIPAQRDRSFRRNVISGFG